MNESLQTQTNSWSIWRVPAGQDCFGEQRGLGISAIAFKVVPKDSSGLLIIENTFHTEVIQIDV